MVQKIIEKINILGLEIDKIPGQIELEEIKNLIFQAATADMNNKKIIVEVGCLFGKSTNAILEGLKLNPSNNKKMYVFDSFEFKKNKYSVGMFNKLLNKEAYNKLKTSNNIINFEDVYKFYTKKYNENLLETFKTDFKNIPNIKNKISLLHLDGPKNLNEYLSILNKFKNNLNKKAKVLFQDYFYSNSVEQYAMVEYLIEKKYIQYYGFSKTTLVVHIMKKIDKKALVLLKKMSKKKFNDLLMNSFLRNEKITKNFRIDKFWVQILSLYFYFLENNIKYADYVYKQIKPLQNNKAFYEVIINLYFNLFARKTKNLILQ